MDVFQIVILVFIGVGMLWQERTIRQLRRQVQDKRSVGGPTGAAALPAHASDPASVPTPEEGFNPIADADLTHRREGK